MKVPLITAAILMLLITTHVAAQQPSPTPPKGTTAQDDVLRVTTNLVQVDAVVTDKEGNHVTDLSPEDFEISEDKHKQQITNFSYVTLGPPVTVSQPTDASSSSTKSGTSSTKSGVPVAAAPLRAEQVHRTIALVVDDLGLSFESIVSVRDALKKFVNEQMQPNDLVAVLRTSKGIGSLQQFTSDKRQLLAAIDNINWYPSGRGGLSPNAQLDTQQSEDATQGAQIVNEMEDMRAALYSVGTLDTLGGILRGLNELPGRKAIMLYAESFKLFSSQGRNVTLLQRLQRLADQANQASTVIYTIDASGVNPLDMTASDRVSGIAYTFDKSTIQAVGSGGPGQVVVPIRNTPPRARIDSPRTLSAQAEGDSAAAFRRLEGLMQEKENQRYEAQSVLSFLAEETGGIFTKNSNNLSLGTQRMLEDQRGYYLIGYKPTDSVIDPATGRRRYRDVTIKVKRSGLRVRSRTGFYGVNVEAAHTAPRTRDQQLAAALTSPFAASAIGLRVTPSFGNDPTAGSYVRALVHVAARDLTFKDQVDGSHRAVIDVVAVNFGDGGRVVDQFSDTQTIDVKGDAYQQALQDGLVFILNVPTKQPGAYQLRVAVRDATSERVGSAYEFVQVPDLNKNQLALSGLFVSGSKQKPATGGQAVETKVEEPDQLAGPAVRRLRQGMILSYAYTIYKAQLDQTGRPQLQTQMRLFREGKEVFTGKLLPFNVGQQTDMKHLDAGGRLLVGGNLVPGEYILQVTVTDALAKNKRQGTATQWIDFEIVK